MELPFWLKIENIVGKLNLSGWFSNEIKSQANTHVHIENFNMNAFQMTDKIQVSNKIGLVPEELTGGKKGVPVNDMLFPFEKPTNFNQIWIIRDQIAYWEGRSEGLKFALDELKR